MPPRCRSPSERRGRGALTASPLTWCDSGQAENGGGHTRGQPPVGTQRTMGRRRSRGCEVRVVAATRSLSDVTCRLAERDGVAAPEAGARRRDTVRGWPCRDVPAVGRRPAGTCHRRPGRSASQTGGGRVPRALIAQSTTSTSLPGTWRLAWRSRAIWASSSGSVSTVTRRSPRAAASPSSATRSRAARIMRPATG